MVRRKKNKTKPRIYVELTAYWGNDDAESTIKVSRRRWEQIQEGANYDTNGWAWYEGSRFSVCWDFSEREVSIYGDGGMQCVPGLPVSCLIVHLNTSE